MIDEFKDIKNAIESLLEILDENGWELNEDGDIVEKSSKRLVWDIYHGTSEDK